MDRLFVKILATYMSYFIIYFYVAKYNVTIVYCFDLLTYFVTYLYQFVQFTCDVNVPGHTIR